MSPSQRQLKLNPNLPPLTPTFCFSTATLKEFLQASRSTIDDNITQHLNALSTPSRDKFDSSSTSRRLTTYSHTLPPTPCRNFTYGILLPAWQSRSNVLDYCASVAASEDPEDPDSAMRTAEVAPGTGRIVDERLDPYSGRFFPEESKTEILAQVVRNERAVENIVRERTWRVVRERCGDFGVPGGGNWGKVLDAWKKSPRQETGGP